MIGLLYLEWLNNPYYIKIGGLIMPLPNAGIEILVDTILGNSVDVFDYNNAMIGVGNSSLVFSVGQTNLQGLQVFRAPMLEGYPKKDPLDSKAIIFKAKFNSDDANFSWNEWGIFNSGPDTVGGTMLVRVIESIGTKNSGASWIFTAHVKFQN